MNQLSAIHKTELLAPAGSPEVFYGAIHAGADAVYLGGKQFGARALAANFTEDELIDCIAYAHREGRKIYLTLNTLLKEKEFSGLYQYLLPYVRAGLDAIIIQDIGVLSFVHRNFPDLSIHASTQMSQTGIHGILELQEMGVNRVIPARELSLDELRHIKEQTDMEIEVFIHGAMCYSYSGQCLFSSMLGGRSGNRGCCAQPCRLPYKVCLNADQSDIIKGAKDRYVSKEAYYLSLKDLYTLPLLPKLLEIGIDSLKIEGRMKKPEYSGGVTAIYRKYIDLYHKGKWGIDPKDEDTLTRLYMRSGQQTGYLFNRNGQDMITLSGSAYRETEEQLLLEIRQTYSFVPKKRKVTLYGSFIEGTPASLTMVHEDLAGTATGDIVAAARTQPTTRQSVEAQLRKLGDTIWEADEIHLELDEHSFIPVQQMKEMRRQVIAQLDEQLAAHRNTSQELWNKAKRVDRNLVEPNKRAALIKSHGLGILCTTDEQLRAFAENMPPEHTNVSGIYLHGDVCLEKGGHLWRELKNKLTDRNIPFYMVLPPVLRKSDDSYMDKCLNLLKGGEFAGCMVRSLEGYGYLKRLDVAIITDHFVPIWNQETFAFWQNRAASVTLPLESNRGEQITLWDTAHEMNLPLEKVVYGRIPMMVTANCIAKTVGKCMKGNGQTIEASLIDRYQKHFPVQLNCSHCMNIIYNSVPLSLHKEISYWKDKAILRLDFTLENRQETKEVLNWAYAGFPPKLPSFFAEGYTTGHESRGVN